MIEPEKRWAYSASKLENKVSHADRISRPESRGMKRFSLIGLCTRLNKPMTEIEFTRLTDDQFSLTDKDHIPSPPTDVRLPSVFHPRPIPEPVTVLIPAAR